MYNEQIENLINLALADGQLTEKEKQILFKKAESAGIDLDEFEMVLDAKLFEKQQSMKSNTLSVAAPKSDKFGDVKKCPACGTILQSFQSKCPDCSHEFIGIDANFSITKLFDMLNTVENSREKNSGISSAFSSLFKDVYGIGSDPILEKKKSIISGFPIPNTKGDILEFLSLAIPNAKQKGNFLTKNDLHNKSHNDLVSTWYSKCEQIVMKAKFSMKEDKKTLEEIINYAKEIGIK
jgi:hypothetical protein